MLEPLHQFLACNLLCTLAFKRIYTESFPRADHCLLNTVAESFHSACLFCGSYWKIPKPEHHHKVFPSLCWENHSCEGMKKRDTEFSCFSMWKCKWKQRVKCYSTAAAITFTTEILGSAVTLSQHRWSREVHPTIGRSSGGVISLTLPISWIGHMAREHRCGWEISTTCCFINFLGSLATYAYSRGLATAWLALRHLCTPQIWALLNCGVCFLDAAKDPDLGVEVNRCLSGAATRRAMLHHTSFSGCIYICFWVGPIISGFWTYSSTCSTCN